MPIFVNRDEFRINRQGEGWVEITLADGQIIGEPAMTARRWSFEPETTGPVLEHGQVEQLLYVISGEGVAWVNDTLLPLEPETVLWLEPGDRYQFKSGTEGLEILQGYAPGQ